MTGGCVIMIISNEKKFIYLRIPKTGSTSISIYFYENLPLESSILRTADNATYLSTNERYIKDGYFDDQKTLQIKYNTHATLQCAIDAGILEYDVSEYSVYGVFRNPLDRFRSFLSMYKAVDGVDISKNFNVLKAHMNEFVFKPQTTWLKHNGELINRLFLYEDVPALVQEIALKYNVSNIDSFAKYNFRNYEKQDLSDRVIDYLKYCWQEDFEICDNLKKYSPS